MKQFRKTKIIATFGPTLKDEKMFASAMKEGVNVIRFNFSHLTPNDARKQVHWVRQQLKKIKHDVAFLGDLKGPEIRTDLDDYTLFPGQRVCFCSIKEKLNMLKQKQFKKDIPIIGIDYDRLHTLVKNGQIILVDDGNFEFTVLDIKKKIVFLKVRQGGFLKSKKSVIIPGVDIGLPILNQQDKENIKVIVEENFSWLAASFVSSAQDVESIRNFVKKCGGDIPIISKIENSKGIKNIDKILDVTQGVMVARGDLGLEFPFEKIPILQEKIVDKAKAKGVVTIIATQMLNSMIESPRPSRPEVSDISYAIRSRVDAVMLSGETASGKYPSIAIAAMSRIILSSESFYLDQGLTYYKNTDRLVPFCEIAIKLAFGVGANSIISISYQGNSARYLSAFRASILNIIATKSRNIYYRSFLYYSVFPILMLEELNDKNKSFKDIITQCKQAGFFKRNDKFIHIFTHHSKRVSKKFKLPTNSIREEIVE